MAEEIWRDVKGYEGLYLVSNYGKVKSVDRYVIARKGVKKPCKGQLLAVFHNKKGYPTVYLSKEGVTKKRYIHRIVAEAFIPNEDNLPQINHKDEVKTNNNVENLEWCSARYNSLYGTRIERRKKTLEAITKTPEYRKQRSEISKKMWENPEYRKRMGQIRSENMKKKWRDPEFRNHMVELAHSRHHKEGGDK